MHIVTSAVVVVLGSATLLLHDRRFIQWKPTVLHALASAAFLGSMFIGKQPLARRMLEAVFKESLQIPARTWLAINALWVGWFAAPWRSPTSMSPATSPRACGSISRCSASPSPC